MTFKTDILSDLDIFLEDDEFAVEATLPSTAKANIILVSENYDAFGVENVDRVMIGKYSDFSALAQGTAVVIGGTTFYLLQTPFDDGTGIVEIPLSKQAG